MPVASCSFRTVLYKGLAAADAVKGFYLDLQDERFEAPFRPVLDPTDSDSGKLDAVVELDLDVATHDARSGARCEAGTGVDGVVGHRAAGGRQAPGTWPGSRAAPRADRQA